MMLILDFRMLTEGKQELKTEAVSAFWSGGWQIASEASRKFSPPPCEFSRVASFTGGWQQLIHKYVYKHSADI